MHEALPNSEVIWYDSVTINGELKWQNQLNEVDSSISFQISTLPIEIKNNKAKHKIRIVNTARDGPSWF